jgi:hypothetical protein
VAPRNRRIEPTWKTGFSLWFAISRKRPTCRNGGRKTGGGVTQEIVDKAHDMGTQAAEHHAGDEAQVFYGFAKIGYLRLGDRVKALNNMLDLNEIDFMMADTPEQYRHVRRFRSVS